MNSFRKFLRLSPLERKIFLGAFCMLPLAACVLRLMGLRRSLSIIRRLTSSTAAETPGPDKNVVVEARAAARMVETAARRGLFYANCLERSLVLWWLIRGQGNRGDVRIGVRKEDTGLKAHAWVELSGVVLNDHDDIRGNYAAFKSPVLSVGMQSR